MTLQLQSKTQAIHPVSLVKRMFQGAAIALVLISMFRAGAGEPNQEWPKLWMIKPLIIVPVAGAIGGVFYYFMDLQHQGGWRKTLATILSVAGFIIVLWLGVVLGLDGTMWD
jgi:hypothetical protein